MRHRLIVCALVLLAAFATLSGVESRAAEFTVNPARFDPYKQFKFRVKWDGKYIPGIRVVSGLTRTTEVITSRPGSAPSSAQRSPGQTTYEPIVLERGRTHDREFETWANKVWSLGAGPGAESSLGDFRKDILVEMYNEAGQAVLAWKVYGCWPSQYTAVSRLDANSTEVAIESMTIEHEGWERDLEVQEPVEPRTGTP
jgi:phage tail-like protein